MNQALDLCSSIVLLQCLSNACLHPNSQTDQACVGVHGTQGNCCIGTYCHKNDPSWAEGRCYFLQGQGTTGASACVPFDGACNGDHGSQGNCCPNTYCHKNDPSWAQGRCYNRIAVTGGQIATLVPAPASIGSSLLPASAAAAAVLHHQSHQHQLLQPVIQQHPGAPVILGAPPAIVLQAAPGAVVAAGAAAAGLPSVLRTSCISHDGVCVGQHGSSGDCCAGLYCHKSDASWRHGRCYFSNAAATSAVGVAAAGASAAASSPTFVQPAPAAPVAGPAPVCVDQECLGDPGTKGDCCDGTYCHKDDYSWVKGKCRPNPVI